LEKFGFGEFNMKPALFLLCLLGSQSLAFGADQETEYCNRAILGSLHDSRCRMDYRDVCWNKINRYTLPKNEEGRRMFNEEGKDLYCKTLACNPVNKLSKAYLKTCLR
jgi:hypothetical protein